jgi:hypothetical protein
MADGRHGQHAQLYVMAYRQERVQIRPHPMVAPIAAVQVLNHAVSVVRFLSMADGRLGQYAQLHVMAHKPEHVQIHCHPMAVPIAAVQARNLAVPWLLDIIIKVSLIPLVSMNIGIAERLIIRVVRIVPMSVAIARVYAKRMYVNQKIRMAVVRLLK